MEIIGNSVGFGSNYRMEHHTQSWCDSVGSVMRSLVSKTALLGDYETGAYFVASVQWSQFSVFEYNAKRSLRWTTRQTSKYLYSECWWSFFLCYTSIDQQNRAKISEKWKGNNTSFHRMTFRTRQSPKRTNLWIYKSFYLYLFLRNWLKYWQSPLMM